ncbi:hypothetical protein KFE25_012951 [Diacronema lutheri]|uniref:PH domain-containing protein n=1 Tax=Diacronema lutheri TaxID=2081491 RepID=A0A8J6C8T1_DIALT|nr:hypothetical protein KFE25_012951 [Diacronema lutheri]
MQRLLQCFGLGDSYARMGYGPFESKAETTISKHARGMLARKEAEALRKEAAEKATARLDVKRTLKKASRRGYGVYSARVVYLSEDERSLVYAKPGAQEVEKSLPFAQMEPPEVSGAVVTISMRNQAKATSVYKFSAATDAEAKVWAHALKTFLPPIGARKASFSAPAQATAPAA